MGVKDTIDSLKELSDDDLFELLDATSEEVKRRNGMMGPSVSDIRSNTVEQNVGLVLQALANVKPK